MFSEAQADFGVGATLPKGVRVFSFRYNYVSGFTEEFDSSGTLKALDRYNIQMDAAAIRTLSPSSYALLNSVLNTQTFPNLAPASALNIGQLNFNGNSSLNVFVPTIGYGLTKTWSIGLAVPIATHSSDVTIGQSGYNNTRDIFGQISANTGALTPAMAMAEADLSRGAAYVFNKERTRLGYKEVKPFENKFMGDVVIGSRTKLSERGPWSLYMVHDLNLPTGPEDDPDDLLDLPVFHLFYLDNGLMQNLIVSPAVALGLGVRYRMNFPDQITVRVPEQAGRPLVSPERKERVERNIADELAIQAVSVVSLAPDFKVAGAFEAAFKGKNEFSGGRGYNYNVLSENTDGYFGKIKFKTTYTRVEHFQKTRSGIPFELSYSFSDSVMGRNYDRQLMHEVIGTVYF